MLYEVNEETFFKAFVAILQNYRAQLFKTNNVIS